MNAAGLRSVGGAIFALLDHTTALPAFSSSDDDGGGRSPYKPPNIVYLYPPFGLLGFCGNLNLSDFFGFLVICGLNQVEIDDDDDDEDGVF